ncbi:MAG: hypothetical protein GY715_07330 [Planctomycetes bacterium]|nr:hypothetical protein [Planctomycetota bacterium]
MSRSIILATILLLLFASAAVAGEPPKVAAASPDHGETNVDPGLGELRIEFDRDMQPGGFSWVGGGPSFPEIRGRPRWTSPRVCVLPVKLAPDHLYVTSLNSSRHTNFRSAAGIALAPHPIWFRTGPADAAQRAAAAPRVDEKLNRRSLEALTRAIDRHYSHRDRLVLDWKTLFAGNAAGLMEADSSFRFAVRTAALLEAAKDLHVTVLTDGVTIPTYRRDVRPNIDQRAVSARLDAVRRHGPGVASGAIGGKIGYIRIDTFDRNQLPDAGSLLDALDACRDKPALIVDVRLNGGGSETIAGELARCFVERPEVYARHVVRDPDAPGGFTPPASREVRPSTERPRYEGSVAVLMGPANMSSCEAFLLMMRQAPNCTLIGARSYGSSGNPQPRELPNGVTVMLPVWKSLLPDGTELEGVGIAPDVEVPFAAGAGRDPVLEEAIRRLGTP